MGRTRVILLAAGRGRRMGADKAFLDLGGRTAVERVVETSLQGGADEVVVVRASGAQEMPPGLQARLVEVPAGGEMIDSLRAGAAGLPEGCSHVLVFPVDYALAQADTVRAVIEAFAHGDPIVLPLHADRPGHPIGLAREVLSELQEPTKSLRDVVVADRSRVRVVAVDDPWVLRDLDTPQDLAGARASLRARAETTTELMRLHRSRRRFHPDPIPDEQLEWLVDTARHASTSSYIQAYSVVCVTQAERKSAAARLCADQEQIHEAPVFLAICADLYKVGLCCARHGVELRSAPIEGFVEAVIDAALFGQNLLLAAESEGLGGCMIGAARRQPRELAAFLELPRHVFVPFGMVLGRPADDPPARGRMPLAAVLHRERYQADGLDEVLGRADEQMRAWARSINESGGYKGKPVNEEKGWTDRMAAKWSHDFGLREVLAAHLRELGFGLE